MFFKLQKVFINQYSIWKKTFKTIHKLSCFVGHPVLLITSRHKLRQALILNFFFWAWNFCDVWSWYTQLGTFEFYGESAFSVFCWTLYSLVSDWLITFFALNGIWNKKIRLICGSSIYLDFIIVPCNVNAPYLSIQTYPKWHFLKELYSYR